VNPGLAEPARRLARSNTAAAIGFVVMWSSGFIGARLGTDNADTITVLLWRFLCASALLLVVWWGIRWMLVGNRQAPSRRQIGIQAAVGLLAQGVYLLGTVGAVQLGVGVGTTALIAALQPMLAGALAGPVLGDRVPPKQWVGLGVGLLGVGLVVSGDLNAGHSEPLWAYGLPFVGMAGLVAATLLEAKTRAGTPLGDSLVIQCSASAVLFVLLGLATGQAAPPSQDIGFWFAVAWFIVLSTLGGYGFYWLNLKRTNVTRVSSLIYLTPPTTMIWAFLMFGDAIELLASIGVVVCLGAVLLSQHGGPEPPS
jgi:drug/metabolite transporter (DMT)-like permease